MLNTNLYNLYSFSVLARLLNYTKAAEVLNISQPALTRIIRSLEEEIGAPLFVRSTRSVKLTAAGEMFYSRILPVLRESEDAVANTVQIASGRTGILKIGVLPYTYFNIIPELVSRHEERWPAVSLQLSDGEEYQLQEALLKQELDMILVSDWGTNLPDSYEKIPVYEDDYCLVVSAGHPLAQKEAVTFDMLREENFLTLNQDVHAGFAQLGENRVMDICTRKGFLPNIVRGYQAKTLLGLSMLVGCGKGVAILAGHMENFVYANENVIFLPIEDPDLKFHGILCYDRQTKNPCIPSFLRIMEEYTGAE